MERRPPPLKHASVAEIISQAQQGNAYFVNRAVVNGDLAQLSENEQRKIVAIANDEAARFALDQIITSSVEAQIVNENFVSRHLNLAIRIFAKAQGKRIKDEIQDFHAS